MRNADSRTKLNDRRADLLREIPAVDELLARPAIHSLEARFGHRKIVDATREALELLRQGIMNGQVAGVSAEILEQDVVATAEAKGRYSLRPVINATGVILHTNLGRAPLAPEAIQHVTEVAAQYSNLEYDVEAGERGKRDTHTDRLFAQLLGAETTLVVNNNAAAVFLGLNTLAEGGEVVVSRGELIEIGGSFRIPDICAKSGAILHEVGTTNRTRIGDYGAAINERTRVLLRVHPSNFRVVGFTERPALHDLVKLAHERNLIVMEDLGSGCLMDLLPFGITDEPTAGSSVRSSVDLVTFSGDKLLGGPQAGILTGKAAPLARIRKNPLFRALRVDKLTIAALEATVELYLRDDLNTIPALHMIRLTAEEIGSRAGKLSEQIAAYPGISVELRNGESVMGGGSTPGQSLPTRLIAVRHEKHAPEQIESMLRKNSTPVIARIERDRVLLDLRTVFESQEEEIVRAFETLSSASPDTE